MLTGLTPQEATAKLKQDGLNELPGEKQRNIFLIFWKIIQEPMLLLLVGCGVIYLLLGEPKDSIILLSCTLLVIGITFYQERKTERALEALKKLSNPKALVIRGGEKILVASNELVVGDIMIIQEGDRVPADAVVFSATNLTVDESLLTGESLAVRKSEWDKKLEAGRPGGEDLPFIYSGTLVVSGHGLAKVIQTGIRTEMGKIGKALQGIKVGDTLLKKETMRLVRWLALAGLILCSAVVIIYGLVKSDWLQGILAGLTLSMSMLPEEFSVILIIFLSLGAWRMSKRHVLTRNTAITETLGAATVFCVDKTGTLTQNKMQLSAVCAADHCHEFAEKEKSLPENYHRLLEFANLASQKDPFDPLEKEIKRQAEKFINHTAHKRKDWKLVKEYPLTKNLIALSHVWEPPDEKNYIVAVKGAPETIADLCHLNKKDRTELNKQIERLASKGFRLLGVAEASLPKTNLPEDQREFSFEFIGLLGFTDPIRPAVPKALQEAYTAGIRVIMITGDYPGTAQFIAKEIGLKNPEVFLTGVEIEKMSLTELKEKIKTINIFARIMPEQKLAIVNALKANNEIVAMTGDGVNDAPALKAANVGVAMGLRGTDVAREAAGLILLDDDFSSIVAATKMGRRIYDNLKKAMSYVIAIHIPIAGLALFPLVLDLPIVLLPIHIAFLELIIDPTCSIVFEAEAEEENTMTRPPRKLNEPLFNTKTILFSVLQGLSVLAIIIIVFLYALHLGKNETEVRTLTFVTLVFGNLMLIVSNLSWSKKLIKTFVTANRTLWLVIALVLTAIVSILFVPWLRDLFRFAAVGFGDLLIITVAVLLVAVWFEVLKVFKR
ncbi:MAG: cation-translocating P-type ATPase [Candidatus Uhrbacteria bacterium]